MRQVICNSEGAVVARMPRPIAQPGGVLVRVHYSMISVGTELAAFRHSWQPGGGPTGHSTPAAEYVSLSTRYLRAALRDPRKAARRLAGLVRNAAADVAPRMTGTAPSLALREIQWTRCAASDVSHREGRLEIVTDDSEAAYQAMSQPIPVAPGWVPVLRFTGQSTDGAFAIGLLNEARDAWLGSQTVEAGAFDDSMAVDPKGSRTVTVVIAAHQARKSIRVVFERIDLHLSRGGEIGQLGNELGEQGWNVGYSASGEVVSVGDGVKAFGAGDLVACCGTGFANHADYIGVPVNLVSRIPPRCDLKFAASAAIGSIALHGVRRAAPQVGERVCVIGLGLLGQITVQILKACGCYVIGMDLDEARVERARRIGLDSGTTDPEALRTLVREATLTGWPGADRTIITAATRSDSPVNLAMDVTRAKGRVVVVGDVGLGIERKLFYQKEIDLLMSTSYGPGRYDRAYEEEGKDYPAPYVRWTLNRNMSAFMEMIANGKVNIDPLIDRVAPVSEVPSVYQELAQAGNTVVGVLIHYPESDPLAESPPETSAIRLRGSRMPPQGVVKYALVGVGAFGTNMLVPQMAKRKDRFFLQGVVSRNAVAAGNFARVNRVPVIASDLDVILGNPEVDLVVIATRHGEHARMTAKALVAGKHVFVEKPLALNWEELDLVVSTYANLVVHPLLMVGFNRRFSPALQALRDAIRERRSPLMMTYRVNAGYVPPESWVHGLQGGGRNIGEACHMYDVFRFLSGAPVRSVDAASIDPRDLPSSRNENFCATISYRDGSLGNLTYTALGPKQGLPKERIEVFCDGEAYLLEDFKSLVRASDETVLWKSEETEKGHLEELSRLGDAIAAGEPSPMAFDEIVETTSVALQVEDLLYGRNYEEC